CATHGGYSDIWNSLYHGLDSW
nr:immunoglobulin heavy chain junction region [Macaca mulatta]MOX59231.1 immunoglobulin heavy chain junction region [Macaca mulatta]MOX59973.1 immunoglobulin heavy chain junction region [Macaca mulatta]MOX61657.1 immunoglobulin heavy chain junction region [Macaca mulatta]MOX62585.1 immunoglobulin heavy chain junction region [Macaca mulatta]